MLIIDKIKTKELVPFGPAVDRDWADLILPATGQRKVDLIQAVIEAYDLGKLTGQAHSANPKVLKATVEKGTATYHLSAQVHQE